MVETCRNLKNNEINHWIQLVQDLHGFTMHSMKEALTLRLRLPSG